MSLALKILDGLTDSVRFRLARWLDLIAAGGKTEL